MQWKVFAVLYALAAPAFLLLDFLWLGVLSSNFYAQQFGSLLGETNWFAVIVLYPILIGGVVYFAAYPAALKRSATTATLQGALFGFIVYATYDLTNLAVVRDWPVVASIVDIAWGTFICAVVAGVSVFIRELFVV